MHRLLTLQLRKCFGKTEGFEESLQRFIDAVGEAYAQNDEDRAMRKHAEVEREELQARLLSTSRRAGMAEVATGVLHNVGNVLNSVNVSATVLAEKLRKSELASLDKAAELLSAHRHDAGQFFSADERGKLIPGFVIDVAQCLKEEHDGMMAELATLTGGIDHIKEIVSAQQSLAKDSTFALSTDPTKIVETALSIQAAAIERCRITIEREYAECPAIEIDTHKVLQILINLLDNARHAVKASRSGGSRKITIRVETIGGEFVRFQVVDTGVGIAAESITRIFAHGFTTKPEGHGFGLHSCANAAAEMGGSLTAHSDGLGRGATFTLDLPISHRRQGEV